MNIYKRHARHVKGDRGSDEVINNIEMLTQLRTCNIFALLVYYINDYAGILEYPLPTSSYTRLVR